MSNGLHQIQSFSLRNLVVDYSSLLVAVVVLVWMNVKNAVPVDPGDGLAHFFIAQHVWNDPTKLLDHWGKPLFTLFSSPFAYFGFKAYIGFNILVFALTSWLAIKIARHFNASVFVKIVFPFALLSVPDYTSNVLGGLTEPFFGLILMCIAYFLVKRNWIWVALVASLIPFSRSEGQFVVLFVALILLYHRQWKTIPLLLTAWFVYAVIGLFALGDFLWYFTHNPYGGAESIYGSGKWIHYIELWPRHFGWMGVIFMGLFLLSLPFRFNKNERNQELKLMVLFSFVIYLGIIFVHAYLWANGKSGAFGLSRLATHGLPVFFLASLLWVGTYFKAPRLSVVWSLSLCLFLFISVKSVKKQGYPNKPNEFEQELIISSEYLKELGDKVPNVFYYHPMIALKTGVNLKATSGVFQQRPFPNFEEEMKRLKGGEIIVRDSHFGPMEMGLTKDVLDSFVRIRSFHAFGSSTTHLGERYGVDIYQYQPNNIAEPKSTVLRENTQNLSLKSKELYLTIEELPKYTIKAHEEIMLEIDLTLNSTFLEPVYLVLQKQNGTASQTYLINELNHIEIPISSNHAEEMLLFIHNPNAVSIHELGVKTKISLIELPPIIGVKSH